MPRDLFQDLRPPRRAGWRGLQASLAVHALAGVAVATLFVRPVASALEERPAGVLRFIGEKAVAPPARGIARAAPSKPRSSVAVTPAPAPAPPIDVPDGLPPTGTFDDTPSPCLSACGVGPAATIGTDTGAAAGDGVEGSRGDGPGAIPIGGDLRPPRKTQHVVPSYPELARRAGVGGVVTVQCVIGVDGSVADARVLRGHPLLDASALEAVRQWRYEPTRLNGIPVPVVMTVTVTFQTQR